MYFECPCCKKNDFFSFRQQHHFLILINGFFIIWRKFFFFFGITLKIVLFAIYHRFFYQVFSYWINFDLHQTTDDIKYSMLYECEISIHYKYLHYQHNLMKVLCLENFTNFFTLLSWCCKIRLHSVKRKDLSLRVFTDLIFLN